MGNLASRSLRIKTAVQRAATNDRITCLLSRPSFGSMYTAGLKHNTPLVQLHAVKQTGLQTVDPITLVHVISPVKFMKYELDRTSTSYSNFDGRTLASSETGASVGEWLAQRSPPLQAA